MIELAIVVVVLGIAVAFSIPAYHRFTQGYQLKAATDDIAAQLRLAREKAIATGVDQTMHFTMNYPSGTDYDYHIHNGAVVGPCWALPTGVTYYSVGVTPIMMRDGRALTSGIVVLQDGRGNRDTVSVQLSGLVLTK